MTQGVKSGVIGGEGNVLVVAGVDGEKERRWKGEGVLVFLLHCYLILFLILFLLGNSRLSVRCGRDGFRFHHCCR